MNEEKDKRLTKIVKQLRKSVKNHGKQADYIEKVNEESNPRIPRKKGQPANSKKHSDLYTDENPKGTIHGLGFKDVATAKASVSKIRNSSRSHAHKIQAAVAMEQRAREMGKTSEAAVYRKFINSMKKKTKAMKEEKHGDHEPEMIRNQLKTAGKASKRIEKHSRKKDNFKAWVQSKITKASDYLDTAADYLDGKEKEMNEEGLRAWFGKSSGTTKSGRKVKGWVQVGGKYDGKPCARQPGQKTTPKCTSSSKRASMSKKERNSAARRKRAADPNQPQKSGAAAPTMVSTDPKKKMKKESMYSDWRNEELFLYEVKDKKGKGSGKKDACYHKVKSRYSVWPSAYASGALVKCRKVGAANWGNSSKKESFEPISTSNINELSDITLQKYEKKAQQEQDKRYAGAARAIKRRKEGRETPMIKNYMNRTKKGRTAGLNRANELLHQRTQDAYGTRRMDDRAETGDTEKKRKTLTKIYKSKPAERNEEFASATFQQFQEKCWKGYEKKGMKTMFGKRYPNCVKKTKKEELEVDTSSNITELKKSTMSNYVQSATHDLAKQSEKAGRANANMDYKTGTEAEAKTEKRIKGINTAARKLAKEDWRSELGYVEEAKKKMVKVKLGDPSKIKVKVTDIGAGGKEYVRKDEMKEEFVAEAESAPNNEQQSRKKNKPKLTPIKKILDKVKYDIADKAAKHKMKQDNPDPESFTEGKSPAWQRKAGKNPSGGLNAKGVASYRAANPGSKLKTAVTTKPSKLKKGSKAANRNLPQLRLQEIQIQE